MNRVIESEQVGQKWFLAPKVIGGAIIAVLALIFVFQNTNKGTVNFFLWDITAPGWLWLLVLFGAGVVVGSAFPWFGKMKKKP
jgi:uncharacterized integral membrane protein